jgi:hypothetical protein
MIGVTGLMNGAAVAALEMGIDSPLLKASMPQWLGDMISAATWKGVRFEVFRVEYNQDSRVDVRPIPYKDLPRVEYLGMEPRVIHVEGRLIGDDVWIQRDKFATVVQDSRQGVLQLPSREPIFGRMLSCSYTEEVNPGNQVLLRMTFVQTQDPRIGKGKTTSNPMWLILKIAKNVLPALTRNF